MKRIIAIVLCAGFLMMGVNVYAQKGGDDTSRLNRFGLHNIPFDEEVAITEEGFLSEASQLTVVMDNAGARLTNYFVQWFRYEPKKGEYDFSLIDSAVRGRNASGIETILTLRPNALWAGGKDYIFGRPDQPENEKLTRAYTVYPEDEAAWVLFVRKLVDRYDADGKNDAPNIIHGVKYWRICNEWGHLFKGTDEEFVRLMKITHDAIKAESPEAMIISPGITGLEKHALIRGFMNKDYIWSFSEKQASTRLTQEDLIRETRGGFIPRVEKRIESLFRDCGAYFDIVDIHAYMTDEEDVRGGLAYIHDQLKKNGLEKKLWALEWGLPFNEFTDEAFNRLVITSQVIGFANGMDQIMWSAFKPCIRFRDAFLNLSLLHRDESPKQAYVNYRMLAQSIGGFDSVRALEIAKGVEAYVFEVKGKSVYVLWLKDEKSDALTVMLPIDKGTCEVVRSVISTPKDAAPVEPKIQKMIADQNGLAVEVTYAPVIVRPVGWDKAPHSGE